MKRTEDEAKMQADLSAVAKKQLPHNCTNHFHQDPWHLGNICDHCRFRIVLN